MKGKYGDTNPLEKLHDGEPYFLLRAQDMHSTFGVRQYAEAVGVMDPKAKHEILAFAHYMEEWQARNPEKAEKRAAYYREEMERAAADQERWERFLAQRTPRETDNNPNT